MNQKKAAQDVRPQAPSTSRPQIRPETGFKPVALPALAAAVHAARMQPRRSKQPDVPAILRKEAMPG